VNTFEEQKLKREEWVSNLKVGDEVALYSSGWGGSWSIAVIEKITPTGRFNLSGGSVANKDGSIRGSYNDIQPVTHEIRERIFERKMRNYVIHNFKVNDLTIEELHKVYTMLKRKYK
jgi:hypothetical protein